MPVYAGHWCSWQGLVGRMSSVLGGQGCCAPLLYLYGLALEDDVERDVASALFPELLGGEFVREAE